MVKGINHPLAQKKMTRQELVNKQRKPYEQVAEGMEAQFLNHMLEELRKTAPPSKPQSQAEKIYRSLLDRERSDSMAKQGIGIKQMVLSQILPEGLKHNSEKVFRPNLNKDIKKAQNAYGKQKGHQIKMNNLEGGRHE